MTDLCSGIKREGESCSKNNNCTYPNCKQTETKMIKRKDALKGGLHPNARLRNKNYTLKDKLNTTK